MFCPHCGASTSDNASFCPKCGKPIPENPAQEEDKRSDNSPRSTSASSSSTRVLIIVAVVLVVAVIGLIIYLLRAPSAPSTTAKSDQPGNEEPATQEEPSQTTEGQDSQQKKTDDTAAQKLEAEHAKLRSDAEAQGRQVYVGTVRIMDGEGASALSGTPINANGSKAADKYRSSTYVALMLDEPTVVSYEQGGQFEPLSMTTEWIGIGRNDYSEDTASQWASYDGKRICISSGTLTTSGGVDVFWGPASRDAALLYEESQASSSSGSNKEAPAQNEDDKHQKLRAEAQAKGLEVFEGTVKIMSLRDLLISRGIPENQLMGEVAGTEAVLILDEPFSRAVPSSIGGTASTTYDIDVLVLGGDHLSQLSPYEPWTEYDGKHVCAAGTLVADLGQMLMAQLHDSECLYEL